MIKAVVFDWNGVIADSLKLDHDIFLKECRRKKLKVPKSVSFYSNMFDDNVFKCLERIGFRVDDEGEQIYRQLYLAGLPKTKPFGGIKPLLKSLEKKYRLAIITSNYSVAVDEFFKRYGMVDMFDLVLGSDTNRHKEEKIKILLNKFSLKKNEIIFVGDTVSDIKACRNSGIKIIAASWVYQDRARLAEHDPDFMADKPSDVLHILEKL